MLAPIGFVLPMSVGAILMSLSTIVVALNAQLLRRLDLRPETVIASVNRQAQTEERHRSGDRRPPLKDQRIRHDHRHRTTLRHGYITDKKGYLDRLKRIEGQARGISRMVDDEKYCIDILTQISAVTSALETVALGLLDDHLRHCVADAARPAAPRPTPRSPKPPKPSPGSSAPSRISPPAATARIRLAGASSRRGGLSMALAAKAGGASRLVDVQDSDHNKHHKPQRRMKNVTT